MKHSQNYLNKAEGKPLKQLISLLTYLMANFILFFICIAIVIILMRIIALTVGVYISYEGLYGFNILIPKFW